MKNDPPQEAAKEAGRRQEFVYARKIPWVYFRIGLVQSCNAIQPYMSTATEKQSELN